MDRAAPALVYLLTIGNPPLIKVGMANVGSRRLGDHQARGWDLVRTWSVADGHEAGRDEATTLRWWRDRGAAVAVPEDVPARDGYTPTVWRGRVDPPETQDAIDQFVRGREAPTPTPASKKRA